MLAKYCRVNLGSYLGNNKDHQVTPLYVHWVHLMMGLVLFPYAAIQGLLWASEVVRGDRRDPNNPFRWENIRLNVPGDPSYSPTISWMSIFLGGNQYMAADFTTYEGDSRVAVGSEKDT